MGFTHMHRSVQSAANLTSFIWTCIACVPLMSGHADAAPSSMIAQAASGSTPVPAPPPEPTVERILLSDAVSRAMANNTTVLTAIAEVRRADALVEQVRASALPTLNASGSYARIDANQDISPYNNQFTGAITISVPLLAPASWAQWAHARDSRKLASLSANRVRWLVAVAVARAYLALIAQHRVVELYLHASETAQAHLDNARLRHTEGLGSALDEARAEQEVRSNESREQSAYAMLAQLQGALGSLLGDSHPIDALQEPNLPPLLDDEAAVAGALQRPDLSSLLYGVQAGKKQLRLSFADFLPTLALTLGPTAQLPALYGTTPPLPGATPWLLGWQTQVSMNVPLYDSGLRYGLLHERRALLTQTEVSLQGALKQVRIDIATNRESLNRATRALAQANQAAVLAQRALSIAQLSYQNGAGTNLEMVDALRRAQDANTAAALAQNEVWQRWLDLLVTSGQFPWH